MKLPILYEGVDLSVLYHGATKSEVESILARGLDPQLSAHAHDEEMNDAENFGPPYHFVYLSTLDGAKTFAPGGRYGPPEGEAAIFEIRLPPELQAKLITNRGEFVRAPFIIEPQYIREITNS